MTSLSARSPARPGPAPPDAALHCYSSEAAPPQARHSYPVVRRVLGEGRDLPRRNVAGQFQAAPTEVALPPKSLLLPYEDGSLHAGA